MNSNETISIVVFANRRDYFFTKLCVSSIRFYYPDVEIFIVKDKLNGNFNTSVLRRAFDVKLLEFSEKYFGWGASKIFFLMNEDIPRKRYLCIDSDIIFIGKVLDKLQDQPGDFVVHPEVYPRPFSDAVKNVFLDEEKIKPFFPDYEYPGFFFNTGQTVVTPGLIEWEVLSPAFDHQAYPYYKNRQIFPLVDQSIMNIALPIVMKRGQIGVSNVSFMRWSVDFFKTDENNVMENFLDGTTQDLVHYAGDVRVSDLDRMKGKGLLSYFRNHYRGKLSKAEILFDRAQDYITARNSITKLFFYRNRLAIEFSKRVKSKI